MACSCRGRTKAQKFLWTPPEGSTLEPVTYDSELQAKAKVKRRGGSYAPVPTGG